MYLKNPNTKKKYQLGDLKRNDKLFLKYSREKDKDGYYKLIFISKNKFKEIVPPMPINPKTKKIFKYGEEDQNGKIYIGKHHDKRSDRINFRFASKEKYLNLLKSSKKYKKSNHSLIGRKRTNPDTNKIWKKGDKRKDGDLFYRYTSHIDREGFFVNEFVSENQLIRKRLVNILSRMRRNKINNNLDIDYLLKIFPKNKKCPVLGININYNIGTQTNNTPSLDKINPSKGYKKGNVIFLSLKANRIKSNATSKEVLMVGNWLKGLKYSL